MPRPRTAAVDRVLLLATADDAERRALRRELRHLRGPRSAEAGRAQRFRVVSAGDGDEALRRTTAQITAAAVDLVLPRRSGLELVHELRARRPDVAILVFTSGAPASEAVAAMLAGADFFHERCPGDAAAFVRALELAVDRRRLRRRIEENEAEVEAARGRLAQLSGDLARALPGLRPPQSRDDVVPFQEAARRYLLAAAELYSGNARGLADRLGVSYFALRRLLARYEVPFPRSRGRGTGAR
jgi:DNA-binding NtrC family response regulator